MCVYCIIVHMKGHLEKDKDNLANHIGNRWVTVGWVVSEFIIRDDISIMSFLLSFCFKIES